ncbi:DUF4436 family protein [Crossiella cryophila]|uniref:DUF4436 domain-containing protein n=1 Tax=Crossiella cryophila TaxID=43355 RepID=A0A7W7CB67_9PSEU|nr:DUF4436 family protein [Crossiella cryophila]MBB4677952.1 hypothetical protein [Crossiella cryophila]
MSVATAKRRKWTYFITPLGVLLAVAVGILAYYHERDTREGFYEIGDTGQAERIDLGVVVQRVDAPARELVLQVLVSPHGAVRDGGDERAAAKDLVVDSSSVAAVPLRFRAGERISAKELRVPLDDGVVSDFPFDRYRTQLYFEVTAGGTHVPTTMNYADHDPFFLSRVTGGDAADGEVRADLLIKRSRSTFILAWFQVIVMWALALSVLAGALHIVRRRLGLVWPALGWMAATLFALVGFRNAAPGLPPIGSMIDYCAFFWAEAVITLALVMVVVKGIRLKQKAPA